MGIKTNIPIQTRFDGGVQKVNEEKRSPFADAPELGPTRGATAAFDGAHLAVPTALSCLQEEEGKEVATVLVVLARVKAAWSLCRRP